MSIDSALIKIEAPLTDVQTVCFMHMSIKPLYVIEKIQEYIRKARINDEMYSMLYQTSEYKSIVFQSRYRDWTFHVERSKVKMEAFLVLFEGKDLYIGEPIIDEIIQKLREK